MTTKTDDLRNVAPEAAKTAAEENATEEESVFAGLEDYFKTSVLGEPPVDADKTQVDESDDVGEDEAESKEEPKDEAETDTAEQAETARATERAEAEQENARLNSEIAAAALKAEIKELETAELVAQAKDKAAVEADEMTMAEAKAASNARIEQARKEFTDKRQDAERAELNRGSLLVARANLAESLEKDFELTEEQTVGIFKDPSLKTEDAMRNKAREFALDRREAAAKDDGDDQPKGEAEAESDDTDKPKPKVYDTGRRVGGGTRIDDMGAYDKVLHGLAKDGFLKD